MKIALCAVISVIVSTLALQNPIENALRRTFFGKIGKMVDKAFLDNRRFNTRRLLGYSEMPRYMDFMTQGRRSPKKRRIKGHHIIDGLGFGTRVAGELLYKPKQEDNNDDVSRRSFRRAHPYAQYRRKSSKRKLPKVDHAFGIGDVGFDLYDLFTGRTRRAHTRLHHLSRRTFFDQLPKIFLAIGEAIAQHRRFNSRRLQRLSRRSPKLDSRIVDVIDTAAEISKMFPQNAYSRRAQFRRQKGGGKPGDKADKGGAKAPPKGDKPAGKPGGQEMPGGGGGEGNLSWEDIFKQIVIKVISGKPPTRRQITLLPKTKGSFQQPALNDLLNMVDEMYYEAPFPGTYWGSMPGLNNGKVDIHSVKYTHPVQTADVEVQF